MPALEAFGRRWHVGSDDFVLPGICDLIIRISWFIAAAVVYWQNNEQLDGGCSGGELIKYFLYGIFGSLQLIIFADIALVHNSKAGSVMDTEKRKLVPMCLYIRTFLLLVEVGWNVVGTYWFSQGILTCPQASGAENLVQGLIICNWLLVAFTFILFILMFDALGAHQYDLSNDLMSDPKLARCWNLRWRFMCLYWWTKNKDIQTTFREFGTYIAAAFESSDVVFSDLICGFILLYLKNREINKGRLQSVSVTSRSSASSQISSCDISSRHSHSRRSQLTEWPKTEEWNSLPTVLHFYRYAMACYSWGVVCCTAKHPLCALWKDAFCCGCIRKNPSPFEIEGDNCCFLHSGSARDVIQVDSAEMVFCSFHDEVYQTPFIVALDHGEKAVVIGIRGTMSRADVVTDLYVRPVSLAQFGYPESYRVHQGMLMNALSVHSRLNELQLVAKLLKNHPDYKIVTTGTSLGSASATLLSLILKKEHPLVDIKCYAYSPSGALMNLEASKYCESFVTSIIYGDDFVGRLAVKSVERLKYDIISILKECRTPKYQILLGGLLGMCGGRPKVTFSPDIDSIRRESRQELISTYGFDYSQINVVPMEGEKSPFYLLNTPNEYKIKLKQALKDPSYGTPQKTNPSPSSPTKLLAFELMYPPGRILHITETPAFRSSRRAKTDDCDPRWNIRWAERSEFREILVSPRMVMDHVPFRPNKALQDLTKRWLHSQNSNEIIAQESGINSNSDNFSNKCIVKPPSSSPSPVVPIPIKEFVHTPNNNQSK